VIYSFTQLLKRCVCAEVVLLALWFIDPLRGRICGSQKQYFSHNSAAEDRCACALL